MNKKALVTGGSGLLGGTFIELYGDCFSQVYCLGRSPAPPGCEWIPYDFLESRDLKIPEVDVIFHFGAQTSGLLAQKNPLDTMQINVKGLIRLLDSASQINSEIFVVHAGTVTQVGPTYCRQPVSERHIDRPATFYDLSKCFAESILLQYSRENLIMGCSLRIANVFGSVSKERTVDRGILDRAVKLALDGKNLSVFGHGDYIRDYIHAHDVARAFYAAWQNKADTAGRYFFIGSGIGHSIHEAFQIVSNLVQIETGRKITVNVCGNEKDLSEMDRRSFVADISQFNSASGWRPEIRLVDGLRTVIRNSVR